jgi:hypothetical protein
LGDALGKELSPVAGVLGLPEPSLPAPPADARVKASRESWNSLPGMGSVVRKGREKDAGQRVW